MKIKLNEYDRQIIETQILPRLRKMLWYYGDNNNIGCQLISIMKKIERLII